MKKAGMKGLGAALVSMAALGAAGPASADVYGLGRLIITDLETEIGNLSGGTGPGAWNFSTSANANLNGASDGFLENCAGSGLGPGTCGGPGAGIVLSGPAANGPGSIPLRGDNDFSVFGGGTEFSSADSAVIDAQLVGDTTTATSLIAESNLVNGTNAAATSNVASGSSLNFEFLIDESGDGAGEFAISFTAEWAAIADITGTSEGSATGVISASARLTSANGTFIDWAPDGTDGVAVCNGGAATACVSVEAGNLNTTSSSGENGVRDENSGSGFFSLSVTGLESGTYSFSLTASSSSTVSQVQEVPAPATLLLLGAGLLAGAGTYRRRRAA